ncbi:GAF and ANTAR domain-containing protein [Pseudonocardia sp. C8]|uniref:GAF and ANTAR domain-containing protein n=1 Tax=Pseudonocardia sp. C8 TaxID=2762759 RepID=UPI001642C4A9|nr:GAF and ANTAR domain-containing protein [Pseudonocardia sp. C8]MBC3192250.1 GAF and ANTAR domain-containing protein [Pseudonocardia sp. C8]
MAPRDGWPPDRTGELAETFVECADTLVAGFDIVEFLIRLCDRCVRLLQVDAAGVVLADPQGRLQIMAATGEDARHLEHRQLQVGEGPCLDCHRTGRAVAVPDMAEAVERWPRFAVTCRQAGFAGVHALPMRYRDQVVGAMNLFARTPGPWGPATARVAQALTDVATIGLLQHRERTDQATVIDQLQTAVTSRVVIEQAKGVLGERIGMDPEQAFQVLRRYARRHNRRLTDLARAVVTGTEDLTGRVPRPPPDGRR